MNRKPKLLRGRSTLRNLNKPHWEVRASKDRDGSIFLEISRIAPKENPFIPGEFHIERYVYRLDHNNLPNLYPS